MVTQLSSPKGTRYRQTNVLGSGAYGTVMVCESNRQTGQKYVVKKVKLARQTPKERFASLQELAMMQQLRHRNLVQGVEGWLEHSHTACLVMDYYAGGDLASLLSSRKGSPIHEEDVHIILVQIASGLNALHANDIVHRDVKTSNIFLTEDGQARLGDLGMCRHLSPPNERPSTTAGTPNYMSPELVNEGNYGKAVDVWALGCVLYEICALRPAFSSFNMNGLLNKIKSGKSPMIPTTYSDDLRALARSMLYRDEERRPSAAEVLNAPFLAEARQRVDAMFGHEERVGMQYSEAAVPEDILALMRKFHRQDRDEEVQLRARKRGPGSDPSASRRRATAAAPPRPDSATHAPGKDHVPSAAARRAAQRQARTQRGSAAASSADAQPQARTTNGSSTPSDRRSEQSLDILRLQSGPDSDTEPDKLRSAAGASNADAVAHAVSRAHLSKSESRDDPRERRDVERESGVWGQGGDRASRLTSGRYSNVGGARDADTEAAERTAEQASRGGSQPGYEAGKLDSAMPPWQHEAPRQSRDAAAPSLKPLTDALEEGEGSQRGLLRAPGPYARPLASGAGHLAQVTTLSRGPTFDGALKSAAPEAAARRASSGDPRATPSERLTAASLALADISERLSCSSIRGAASLRHHRGSDSEGGRVTSLSGTPDPAVAGPRSADGGTLLPRISRHSHASAGTSTRSGSANGLEVALDATRARGAHVGPGAALARTLSPIIARKAADRALLATAAPLEAQQQTPYWDASHQSMADRGRGVLQVPGASMKQQAMCAAARTAHMTQHSVADL